MATELTISQINLWRNKVFKQIIVKIRTFMCFQVMVHTFRAKPKMQTEESKSLNTDKSKLTEAPLSDSCGFSFHSEPFSICPSSPTNSGHFEEDTSRDNLRRRHFERSFKPCFKSLHFKTELCTFHATLLPVPPRLFIQSRSSFHRHVTLFAFLTKSTKNVFKNMNDAMDLKLKTSETPVGS